MIIISLITLIFCICIWILKNRQRNHEISGNVFKRKVPTRMTDTWKTELRMNPLKLDTTLVGNPEIMAYFIVENIQDYRKSFY